MSGLKKKLVRLKMKVLKYPQLDKENERHLDEKPRVIIVGRNYSSNLCMARAFGKAGYEVEILRIFTRKPRKTELLKQLKPDAFSKYVKAFYTLTEKDSNRIAKRLIRLSDYNHKMLLIPTDDLSASAVDEYYDKLSKYYLIPNVNQKAGEINRMMNKEVQNELAIEAGLPVVNSCVIATNGGKFTIPETVNYPCFIKPNVSKDGLKSKMRRIDSEEELRKVFKEYSEKKDIEMIVEDYLDIGREMSILGVSTKDGVLSPGLFAAEKGGHKGRRGVAFTGEVLPTSYAQELIDNISKFISKMNYTGLFDIDLIETKDGKIYFVEMNMRYGGSGYSIVESGVNLPGMFADYMLKGKPIDLNAKLENVVKHFVSEKIGMEEYVDHCITMSELKNEMKKADIRFIYDKEDTRPYNHFKKFYMICRIRRMLTPLMGGFKDSIKNIRRIIINSLRSIKARILNYPQIKEENKRNPNAKPRVMIVGRNYSSNLCMARSFGKAGYEVEILRIFNKKPRFTDVMKQLKPDAYSKYVKAFYVTVTKNKNKKIVSRLVSIADLNNKMLLIPTDDLSASTVDENYDELKRYYLMPNVNNKQGEINRMMNKDVQNALAVEANLPVVNSCVIATENRKFEIPESVTYPCFIKPNVSKDGLKSKMRKIDSEIELIKVFTEYSEKKDIEMIVEDYLDIGREMSILGVSTKDGVLSPGLFAAEKGGHKGRRGVAFTGEVLPTSYAQELIDNISKFISKMNYTGLFDIDLIETKDGKIYFVEMNMRYGGSGYSIVASGVNLPGMFADYMLMGKPIDMNAHIENTGKHFISEKIGIEEYMENCISKSEFKEEIKKADIHFIYDKEDIKPYKHFKKYFNLAKFKNFFRKTFLYRILLLVKSFIQTFLTIDGIKQLIKNVIKKVKRIILNLPQDKEENYRDPNAKPRVMIVGRNYSSNLCMARSFGKAGYEVEILRVYKKHPKITEIMKLLRPDAYSKYVKAFYACTTNKRNIRIIRTLQRLGDISCKMLLIPTDDLSASIVDEHYDELKMYYLMPNVNNTQGEINRMMDKDVQNALAIQEGLPVVNSCVITTDGGKFDIPETVTYPCFIKPKVSKDGLKSKMRRINSEKELIKVFKEYSEKKDIEMVVEDYLEIGREMSILGVSTKDGVLSPGLFAAEKGGHKGRRGVAFTGEVLPTSYAQELIDNISKFISKMNYTGLFDIDLIETKDGKIYFVEMNMRYGGSGYSIVASGVNLPGMFADYMLMGKPIDMNAHIENTGKHFISEKIGIEECMENCIKKSELKNEIKKADIHFIYDKDDMRPYKHFNRYFKIMSFLKF